MGQRKLTRGQLVPHAPSLSPSAAAWAQGPSPGHTRITGAPTHSPTAGAQAALHPTVIISPATQVLVRSTNQPQSRAAPVASVTHASPGLGVEATGSVAGMVTRIVVSL